MSDHPSHVTLGDERITWAEYMCRGHRHFLSDITNAMVRKKMCQEASIEIVHDDVEGWCLLVRASDGTTSEEHLLPGCQEDIVSQVVQMAERFRARNGSHEPDEPRRLSCDRFRQAMGLLVPSYERERLKWN